MAKQQEPLRKDVIVESLTAEGATALISGGFLSREFALAVSRAPSAELTLTATSLRLKISRTDFAMLLEEEIFSPALTAAFTKADDRLAAYDRQRQAWYMRAWDMFTNHSNVTSGAPIAVTSEAVPELPGVQVTVRRFGV